MLPLSVDVIYGWPLRNLGHLASGSWQHLVQRTLHHGLAKNWFTVIKESDEACWLKKYEITSIGRHEKENGVKELARTDDKCVKSKEEVIRRDHSECPIDYSGRSKALGMPELLSHIFSYLEYQDLKSCRDVSQQWRGVVLRYYFNDNLGNSPRVLASAVSENSTTLRMKTLRFDIGLEGGKVMDVQRDKERTFVAVKDKSMAAIVVYEGLNLVRMIPVKLPKEAKEFYTMVGTKTIVIVSYNGKGSLSVRSMDRFSLKQEWVFGARMHLHHFSVHNDEMWLIKEDAMVSKRQLVMIVVPMQGESIRRESVDIGKIIPRDDSMFSADFDDIILDRQYDLRVTQSGRVMLLLLPPLRKVILIKVTHNGKKIVHELPIQLSKDSVIVDLDDSVAILLDDRFVHFVNYSEYPGMNVTHLRRNHKKTKRFHYPVVGFGGFNFERDSVMRQVVVFYSLDCYHSHLTEAGPYRMFKREDVGSIISCNAITSAGKVFTWNTEHLFNKEPWCSEYPDFRGRGNDPVQTQGLNSTHFSTSQM